MAKISIIGGLGKSTLLTGATPFGNSSSSSSSSSSSASSSSTKGSSLTAGSTPTKGVQGDSRVDVTIGAINGPKPGLDDLYFKMFTKAYGGKAGDVSVANKVRSVADRPDKLAVKVAVDGWAAEPNDRGNMDFLLCVTGGKKPIGPEPRDMLKWEARDVDLVLNLNLKGLPLRAKVKSDHLKTVKCKGADGTPGIGYLGQADNDGHTIKVALSPAKGGPPVAVLTLAIQADDASHNPHVWDFIA